MSSRAERNQAVIDEFRANGGHVGGAFTGIPLLLLHSRGAKSGEPRIHPLAYIHDGDRLVVTAPNGGRDQHPAWYYNLLADPNVTAEIGTEQFRARAIIAEEPERTRLYARMVSAIRTSPRSNAPPTAQSQLSFSSEAIEATFRGLIVSCESR